LRLFKIVKALLLIGEQVPKGDIAKLLHLDIRTIVFQKNNFKTNLLCNSSLCS